MAVVGSFAMPEPEVLDIIRRLDWDRLHFIRSNVEQIEFGSGKNQLLSHGIWETGRVFCEDLEIRWQLDSGYYRMTVLTEGEELPAFPGARDYEDKDFSWDTWDARIILWGQYRCYSDECKGFIQVRIPAFQNYPDPQESSWVVKDIAAIQAVSYSKEGVVLYTRFKEIVRYVG